jgi:glycosyltransferase involved in cell wall biosynthesis
MDVLFLTLIRITDVNDRGIYNDLIREFRDNGHQVFVVTPTERRFNLKTGLSEQDGIKILRVQTLNIQKTNIIEKGIGTIFLEYQFQKAIKKYLGEIRFDLILYSTPPITLTRVVKSVKKNSKATSYLLLKDIFPQNAVDLNMFSKHGLLYKYFRWKERELYNVSDYIGTMSPANVKYLIGHNPQITPSKIEVCPNSIKPVNNLLTPDQKKSIRIKYKIPLNSIVFIYGGNLGKPQGLDFFLKVLESNRDPLKAFFVIIGSGTEYSKIKSWFDRNNPANAILLSEMPKNEYDQLVQSCDVGMIFLDIRFTIPNYPSRLLSYLENKMPVIAATDPNTDVGKRAEENSYGFWSMSGDIESINKNIGKFSNNPDLIRGMGEFGYRFLRENYTVENSYKIIMSHFKKD